MNYYIITIMLSMPGNFNEFPHTDAPLQPKLTHDTPIDGIRTIL